ncbi:class I SAM-dependent methyltransferase [Rhodohalobacter sulfatireducens]|uniref:Methyltransferase domain-containing protein n=1 Tax=Rhodohalobacter sulfatireducens TaxID=2911366 RepID=A0ABS9KG96_9BACT|nr:class I SAM-dependent methyltransferase [Rhodohalobacter sulfatireducens]MCG2589863.1 methyltransferase domain-containing protein [Rhodohalobacter sulfatireducens]
MNTSLNNKSSVEEIRKRFDHDVERFSNLETGQQATVDAPLTMELITQAAASNNPDANNILDIGCGAGNNTLKLLEQLPDLNCDLIDLSQPMLDRAEARVKAESLGRIRTLQDDFRKADLPSEHYDIVIAAAVLHHLRDDEDWDMAFQKIFDVTAPGGSVWITDLVTHEVEVIDQMMWSRYGDYLETIGSAEYRKEVFAYIEKEDSPRPVTYQLDLLKKSGFERVEILHKNSCFAAFGAIKAGS